MQFGKMTHAPALTAGVLSIKHFLMPLVAFGLARLWNLDSVQTAVLLAFSASPTASSAYVLAARMGGNGPFVAGLVTLSTLLGMVAVPGWVALRLGWGSA